MPSVRSAVTSCMRPGRVAPHHSSRPGAAARSAARHGAASLAHAAGADLKTVQEQLGHTSIVLTADTYTSVLVDLHFERSEEHTSELQSRVDLVCRLLL